MKQIKLLLLAVMFTAAAHSQTSTLCPSTCITARQMDSLATLFRKQRNIPYQTVTDFPVLQYAEAVARGGGYYIYWPASFLSEADKVKLSSTTLGYRLEYLGPNRSIVKINWLTTQGTSVYYR